MQNSKKRRRDLQRRKRIPTGAVWLSATFETQFLVDLRFLCSSSDAACNAPPTLRATQVYQTFLSLLPFAFFRVFRGQLFLIGFRILLFKLSSLSFVGAAAPSGSRGSLERRVAAR